MVQLQILYGILHHYHDVTAMALERCLHENRIILPTTDVARAEILGDPLFGTLKHLRVETENGITVYASGQACVIDLMSPLNTPEGRQSFLQNLVVVFPPHWKTIVNPVQRLFALHSTLQFVGGNIRDEFEEQVMAITFLKPEAKVLELGSNIGRNTLTIAACLADQNNLVTMECDPKSYAVLVQNRDLNHYTFRTENSALSYQKLIQKGWDTIPSEEVLPGYVPVSTITFEALESKYNIQFDTMVVDCEGALYYILKDRPSILQNMTMLIMENDYHNIEHKNYIDALMRSHGLSCIYSKSGGWGACVRNFYEVWAK